MFLHIITRQTAKERGFVRYFTGQLCPQKKHIAERNTKSSSCLVCDKERKKEYRLKHPEKARASVARSRKKHVDQRRLDNKAWREKNKEHIKNSRKRYTNENREKVAASKKRYYLANKDYCLQKSREHREKNKDRYIELGNIWRDKNRDRVRLLNRKRKETIRSAKGSHTVNDIENLKTIQKMTCAACYVKFTGDEYHVDHIYPLARGGNNDKKNLQLLCPPCNMSKGAKMPEDFYQERGFLL